MATDIEAYEKEGKLCKKDELLALGPRTEAKLQPIIKGVLKFLNGKGKGLILNIQQIREGAGYGDEDKHDVRCAVHILAHGGVVRLTKIGGGYGRHLVKATGKAYEPGVMGELKDAPEEKPKKAAKAKPEPKAEAKAAPAPKKAAKKAAKKEEEEESVL